MKKSETKIPTFVYATSEIAIPGDGLVPKLAVGILVANQSPELKVNFVAANRIVNVKKQQIQVFDPLSTGDQLGQKVCNVCHRLLPTQNFARNQNGKGDRIIRRPSCNECREVLDGKQLKPSEKKKWEKSKPDMQIFECPICHKITIAGLTSKVVLDHDHETGQGRG